MLYPEQLSLDAYISLELGVQRRIQDALDRRKQRPFSTTGRPGIQDYDGVQFRKRYADILALIFLCWYSSYFRGFESYILYEVRLYLHRTRLFPELSAMTTSKELALLVYLLPCQKNSTDYLFGTVLDPTRIERVISNVSLKWIVPRKPKVPRRHRGYRDHGTLRPDSKWVERFDAQFVEMQAELEKQYSVYQQVEQTLVRAAGEWYLRTLA